MTTRFMRGMYTWLHHHAINCKGLPSTFRKSRNPTCSSELWNTLGEGLFEYGRDAEARSAYFKCLEVNDADVRVRYNLARVYQREKNFPGALAMIAEGLSLDKMGQYRESLLAKQQEVVAHQVRRHQTEYLLLVNLVSKFAAPAATEFEGAFPAEKVVTK